MLSRMEVLASNDFVRLYRERGSTLLRYERTPASYASVSEVLPAHRDVIRQLDTLGRASHVLLVDLRAAPLNNAPGFEETMATVRAELMRGFPRVALVVRSAAGLLQVQRHTREDGREARVFHGDLEGALAYLTSPSIRAPASRRGK
jgi:hypothetical protein